MQYPSDMTDQEWEVISPFIMPSLGVKIWQAKGGRLT